MKIVAVAAVCAASLSLAGCATNMTEFMSTYVEAANTLDPGCGKDVRIDVLPLMMPWGPIPFVTGSYRKACNLDQFGTTTVPPARPALVVGATVGGPDPVGDILSAGDPPN
jgi:predicted small secreted protein